MIAEVLNREFVLQQLADVRARLAGTPGDAEVAQALSEAEAREREQSSGQRSFSPPPAQRRGVSGTPLDDLCFISHDPVVSLFQSVLEEYVEAHPLRNRRTLPPAAVQRRGDGDPMVTDRALGLTPVRNAPANRRLFDRYSITDVQWVRSKLAESVRLYRGKHAFNEKRPQPVTIADRARVLLVGDWATGVPRARKVGSRITRELDAGRELGVEQHLVHLGDVYYSGFPNEVRKRFLQHWPVPAGDAERIGSWAVNANHDMFSGGYGYFDVLLADARFTRQQQSSFFTLVNRHWKIVGLDTAWDDHGLKDPQAEWLGDELDDGGRKTVLLSHHQLDSPYEQIPDGAGSLRSKVFPILKRTPVTAWFWGHEHRCLLLKENDSVRFGRCLGHGGVPVYMNHEDSDPYPVPLAYEYRGFISSTLGFERWALLGFAVLDLDGDKIHVRYIDENGHEHKTETIG
jgi:hypothetical protein